ncbi:MAG: Crp/Fnr family transcriptional regulator [Chloroflexi bacterium]|nr:MAG: hypothetical protein CUN54_05990 [Phototrophicales bacterium]RMF81471.1 MAG: Crp/Fnr family transcriptional regulator [Chloroflexota bacterium]
MIRLTEHTLHNLDLFAGLGRDEITAVLDIVNVRAFRAGQIIFRPGDASDRLMLLHHGTVKTYIHVGGQERIMHVFQPGDAFCGLLFGTRHGDLPWAEAMTDAVVCIMDEAAFMRFMVNFPRLCLNLFRYMADHHAADMRRIEGLLQANATHRLIHVLLEIGHRLGYDHADVFALDPTFTQEDLASMIGVARPTVSTMINDLRRLGVLSGSGRNLIVHRQAALQFLNDDNF